MYAVEVSCAGLQILAVVGNVELEQPWLVRLVCYLTVIRTHHNYMLRHRPELSL